MLRPVTLAVVVVALLSAAGARLRVDPLVETRKGLIKGLRSENGEFSKFLGVPYALVDEDNPFGVSLIVRFITNVALNKTPSNHFNYTELIVRR